MFVNVLQQYYHLHFLSMAHRGSTSRSNKRALPAVSYPVADKKSKYASTSPEAVPKNLHMLSKAACPSQKGRSRPNALCSDVSHSVSGKKNIQKHTCKRCLANRIKELLAKEHLHHWDAVNILMREFRRYYCGFCLFEAFKANDFTSISLSKRCSKGHGVISSMRHCDHGKEFKYCRVCKDPRAGGRFKACGCQVIRKCECKVPTGDEPLPEAEIAEKDAWVEAALERARQMQAAGFVTPPRRVVVVEVVASSSASYVDTLMETLMEGVSGGGVAAPLDAGASDAADVLGQLKTAGAFEDEEGMMSADEATPSISSFGSPVGSSGLASSASSFGTPGSCASISVQALIDAVPDLPTGYETESDGEMWVIDDRSDAE